MPAKKKSNSFNLFLSKVKGKKKVADMRGMTKAEMAKHEKKEPAKKKKAEIKKYGTSK